MGVATVESLTKLLTLARSQRGLALHLSAHAYLSEKASGAGDGSEMGQHMFLAEIMENHGKSWKIHPQPGDEAFWRLAVGFFSYEVFRIYRAFILVIAACYCIHC